MKKLASLLILLFATSLFVGDADARYILSQARATVSPARVSILAGLPATENFTGTDTTSINGRVTTTGVFTWSASSAVSQHTSLIGISSNLGYAPTDANGGDAHADIDTGATNITVTLTVVTKNQGAPNASYPTPTLRGASATDFFYFYHDLGGCWFIGHSVNGTIANGNLANDGCTHPYSDGDILSLQASGSTFTASLNGVVIITTTSAANPASTLAGLTIEQSATLASAIVDDWSATSP